jgi:soluble lytic murein transglycosylase-like protein
MKKVLILLIIISLFSCNNKQEISHNINYQIDSKLPKIEIPSKDKEIRKIIETARKHISLLSFSEAEIIYNSVQEEINNYNWIYSALVYSIIENESKFKKYAYNDKNSNNSVDYGYMQVNEISRIDYNNHHKEKITSEQLMNDTALNIKVGCWVLNKKRERLIIYGIEPTEENIIKAYNCGEGRVRDNRVPLCTENYQKRVSEKIVAWLET